MKRNTVCRIIGQAMLLEAFFMLIPLGITALYDRQLLIAFLAPCLILCALGLLMLKLNPKYDDFTAREGIASVALTWIVISFFGTLPFYLAGVVPSFIDGLFESVSGFTTTGATIFNDVESLPSGILFWRSFSHWIGGMGVLVFMLAIMPNVKGSAVQILRAESTGVNPGKVVPKMRETASIMYKIYLGLTVLCFVCLLIAGMPAFDALLHAMGTAGTGGMSGKNDSIGAYGNVYVDIIITVFMVLFMVNFSLFHMVLLKNIKGVFKNQEFQFFLCIFGGAVILMTLNLVQYYGSFGQALRYAAFQGASIMSTTGYATADYNFWPSFSKSILLLMMLVGGCAGSTAGGLKIVRLLTLLKGVKADLRKKVTPGLVMPVKIEGKVVHTEIIHGIFQFFFMYMLLVIIGTVLISLEEIDIVTGGTAMLSMVSNVGPGLNWVGPMENFSNFTWLSKLFFCFTMLAGRLEIIPVLMLFSPSLWRKL